MKVMQGKVVFVKDEKTAKVSVVRQWQHPLYQKSVKRSKNYICHVEGLKLKVGDDVNIQEIRPVSKMKKFKVTGKVKI